MRKIFLIQIFLLILQLSVCGQYFDKIYSTNSTTGSIVCDNKHDEVLFGDKMFVLYNDSNSFYLSKMRLDGTILWHKTYFSVSPGYLPKMLFSFNGDLIMVLCRLNDQNSITRIDTTTGAVIYSKEFQNSSLIPYQAVLLNNGQLVVSGGDGNSDNVICSFDANTGNLLTKFTLPGLKIYTVFKAGLNSFFIAGRQGGQTFITRITDINNFSNSGMHILFQNAGQAEEISSGSDNSVFALLGFKNGVLRIDSNHNGNPQNYLRPSLHPNFPVCNVMQFNWDTYVSTYDATQNNTNSNFVSSIFTFNSNFSLNYGYSFPVMTHSAYPTAVFKFHRNSNNLYSFIRTLKPSGSFINYDKMRIFEGNQYGYSPCLTTALINSTVTSIQDSAVLVLPFNISTFLTFSNSVQVGNSSLIYSSNCGNVGTVNHDKETLDISFVEINSLKYIVHNNKVPEVSYTVSDLCGNLLLEKKSGYLEESEFSLEAYPSGFYLLKISDGQNIKVYKLIRD